MKMTVSRMFEAGRVLEAFRAAKIEGLEGFVEFISDLSENVIRGMRGQLTFKDNHAYEERTVEVESGVPLSIKLGKSQQAHLVMLGKTEPYGFFPTSWGWKMNLDGTLSVTVNFPPVTVGNGKLTLLLAIFY